MPTQAQLDRLALGGAPGYAPAPPRPGSRLSDLLMMQGQQRAEAAQQQGNIWASALSDVGNSIAGQLQQNIEKKAMAKRDAAWVATLSDSALMSDPKAAYAKSVEIWGPQEGPKQFQALAAVSQLSQPKRNPEQDTKALGMVGGAMGKMTDQGRAALWPQARTLAHSAFPDLNLPEQYSPETWGQIAPLLEQINGGKPPEGFTLKPGEQRFDASGKPIASVAAEEKPAPGFSLSPGEVRYDSSGKVVASRPAAPKEPKAPEWKESEDAQGNPILVDYASGRTKPYPAGAMPKPGAAEANRIAAADAALSSSAELKSYLAKPEVRAAIGPAMGRFKSLEQAAGAGDPVAVQLVGMLKSYSALQPQIHGFRNVKFAQDIESLLNTHQTPESLEAALRGIDSAAINVRDRRHSPSGSGAGPAQPKTKAEFDALAPGTPFIAPDGSRRIK